MLSRQAKHLANGIEILHCGALRSERQAMFSGDFGQELSHISSLRDTKNKIQFLTDHIDFLSRTMLLFRLNIKSNMRKSNSRKTDPERGRGKSISSKSSVSQAATYTGIADFWDEHDLSDYWDKTRSVRADVDLESEESLYAIEKGLSQTICRDARERGVSPHTLINL